MAGHLLFNSGSNESSLAPQFKWLDNTFNPFIFIRNKRRVISSEGFSVLEKNTLTCPQRAVLSGTTARCRLKWPFGALF